MKKLLLCLSLVLFSFNGVYSWPFKTKAHSSSNSNTRPFDKLLKKKLISKTEANAKDEQGSTLLMHAVRKGDNKLIKKLIGKGADVNAKDNNGQTALMTVAGYVTPWPGSTIKTLIDAGADINATDNDGKTVLMLAVINKQSKVVKALIKAGADVDATDNNGKTALIHAAKQGDSDTVEILLNAGANINAQDNQGYTPLIYTVIGKDQDSMKILLSGGADVNQKTKDGRTVFEFIGDNFVEKARGCLNKYCPGWTQRSDWIAHKSWLEYKPRPTWYDEEMRAKIKK